jgi:predicted Zn-dependent protease
MSKLKYRVNWKFLLGVLVIAGALAAGTHYAYKRQFGKQADVLRELADAAEARGEPAKCADYLRRYLRFKPRDYDTKARFGLLLSRLAQTANGRLQAYLVLDGVLRNAPDRDDLRRRAAEIALSLGPDLTEDIKRHLKVLIDAHPKDGELESLYADLYLMQAQFPEAEKKLELAATKQPDLFAAYVRRALLLRERLNRPEEADRVVEEMLKHGENSKAARAHLAAAAYWDAADHQDRRTAEVAAARNLAPDDLEVLLVASELAANQSEEAAQRGDAATAKAKQDEARTALQRGIELHAHSVEGVKLEAAAALDDETKRRRAIVGELFRGLTTLETRAGRLTEAESTARRGRELLPESAALLVALADVHIRKGQYDDAGRELDELEKSGYSLASVRYQRGRILAGKGDWLAAARTLEEVLAQPKLSSEFVVSASLLLGGCYEQLGELDRRYAAYRKAATADRRTLQWITANDRLAATLLEMGQEAEAMLVYEKLATRTSGANIPLGRLLLAQTLRKPAGQRNWTRTEQVIQATPPVADAAVLRAELTAARGDVSAARDALSAAVKKFPDSAAPVLALASLEYRDKHPDRARELIATARSKFGATATIRLAEAYMIAAAATPDTAAQLAKLAEGAEKLPRPDARRLLRRLADLATATGSADLANKLHERLTAAVPNDLGGYLSRLDDALRRNDEAGAQAMLDRVQAIDGADGTNTQAARAVFLIWKAQRGDRSHLQEAEDLLAAVRKQRPWWPRVSLGQALVADLKGDHAAAATRYREAVDAGETRPEVVRRLLELYAERQQYRDAEQILKKLPDSASGTPADELLAAELSIRAGNTTRAVQLAAKAISDTETDPRKLLWLAQVRRLANSPAAQIEKPIRRAVAAAADQPAPRVALVQFLVSADRKKEAEEAAREAERKLGPSHAAAIAQCYEAVGQTDRARQFYETALKGPSPDVPALRAAANFYLRTNNLDTAEQVYRKILNHPKLAAADRQEAIRYLSVLSTARHDYQTSRKELEALGILDHGLPTRLSGQETIEQLRTRATALAVQPDARLRREAITALETMELRKPLAADDQYLLARLLVSIGDWPKARGRLAQLARSNSDNLVYLAYYGLGLLRFDGDIREARRCVELLEKAQPDATRTIEVKARLLEAEGKPDAAAAVLQTFAGKDGTRQEFAAALLDRLGLADRAEPYYRKLAADPARPSGKLRLASYLGRQGKTADALAALPAPSEKIPPIALAAIGTEILYHAPRVEAAAVRQVEQWIQAARKKGTESTLAGMLAVIRMAEGKNAEAIRLYQDSLKHGSKDAVAMNNLGYLLAIHGRRFDEALLWVHKAVEEAAGPRPLFIDTEAVILTAKGDAERAVELLTDATKESSDPGMLFHLAQAHQAAGNRTAAAAAMRQAKRLKIRAIDVPPPERKALEQALKGVR